MWCAIFFFASTGTSAAYLTVSEILPLELRAQAISFFFAVSLLLGGVSAPLIFGYLVKFPTHGPLAAGYYAAGAIMFAGGLVAWCYGVDAERKSLEGIAYPLSAVRLPAIEPPTGSA
jgi:MFS family permease